MKAGESEASIKIPLVNDPSGTSRHFVVKLVKVVGRDQMGDKTNCKVNIVNKAS